MNEGVEELTTIAAAVAEATDMLAWIEVWLAARAMECGYPGVIAKHLRQSRWRVKRLNIMAERFPYLVPSNREASAALLALNQVELYAPDRQEIPDKEIPIEIYRLAAKEGEGVAEASAYIRLVREQSLSLRELEKLVKRQKGKGVAIPYMTRAKMAARIDGDNLILSPAEGEPFEFHGEPPSTLVVTAIEVENAPE